MKVLFVALVALLLAACAPEAKLLDSPIIKELDAGKKSGAGDFDHAKFDAYLKSVVDPSSGFVNYELAKSQQGELDAYLESVSTAKLAGLKPEAQKALLINAYNGYTLKLILENLPIASIRDIDKPWKTRRYKVGGHTMSLDDIEHGVLRPYFLDERIHFAVNCASVGCPPLAAHAFDGSTLDKQLEAATRRTLQDQRYVRVDSDRLVLTNILNWYGSDFTNAAYRGHESTLARYVAKYAAQDVKNFVESKGGDPDISWLEYDWSLNAVER